MYKRQENIVESDSYSKQQHICRQLAVREELSNGQDSLKTVEERTDLWQFFIYNFWEKCFSTWSDHHVDRKTPGAFEVYLWSVN